MRHVSELQTSCLADLCIGRKQVDVCNDTVDMIQYITVCCNTVGHMTHCFIVCFVFTLKMCAYFCEEDHKFMKCIHTMKNTGTTISHTMIKAQDSFIKNLYNIVTLKCVSIFSFTPANRCINGGCGVVWILTRVAVKISSWLDRQRQKVPIFVPQ